MLRGSLVEQDSCSLNAAGANRRRFFVAFYQPETSLPINFRTSAALREMPRRCVCGGLVGTTRQVSVAATPQSRFACRRFNRGGFFFTKWSLVF